jgi:DNA repair protein RecO (recombination protein O)
MPAVAAQNRDIAYVLHTRPYRETSLLATLFARESGRFSAVARASRNARGGNPVRPFARLHVSWVGKTDLKTLRTVEIARPSPVLAGERLFVGLYLNELVTRLLHEGESHQVLFDRYDRTLEYLAGAHALEPMLRIFELSLLEDLGYGLRLDIDCLTGAPVVADGRYRLIPGEGVTAVENDDDGAAFSGEHLLAIAVGRLDGLAVLRSAKRLTRLALTPYLGDKPLASRDLFRGKGPDMRSTL